jgi:hypothetical protein
MTAVVEPIIWGTSLSQSQKRAARNKALLVGFSTQVAQLAG